MAEFSNYHIDPRHDAAVGAREVSFDRAFEIWMDNVNRLGESSCQLYVGVMPRDASEVFFGDALQHRDAR